MSTKLKSPIIDKATTGKLSAAILEIGQSDFAAALLDLINAYCPFDSSLVMLYSDRRRPDVLLDRLPHALRQNSADHYIAGAYLVDPFYIHAKSIEAPALLRMRDIAPLDFDTSEYFVSYYKQSNVVDELNYLVPIADGRIFAIAFERSSLHQPYTKSEIETCESFLPLIAALVTRHVAMPDVKLPRNDKDDEHVRLEAILRNFGAKVLTPRECEVVQLMLYGHSASSVASLLSVSIETVRVHRRHIYEKFNISSLAELFALALKAIYSQAAVS